MTGTVWLAGLFALSLLSAPALALADIYQWEDAGGVIHFTDDMKKVPVKYRDKVRVQKSSAPDAGTPAPESPAKVEVDAGSGEELYGEYTLQWWLETFRKKKAEINQAASLVETKKQFVQIFERGRRFGQIFEQTDIDKYNAYKAELPADEQRLNDITDEVAELRRRAGIFGVPKAIVGQ